MSRPRFRPKATGGKAPPVAIDAPPARFSKINGQTAAAILIEAKCNQIQQSKERWKLIEDLLHLEGYEIVPDLFEHSIRKRHASR